MILLMFFALWIIRKLGGRYVTSSEHFYVHNNNFFDYGKYKPCVSSCVSMESVVFSITSDLSIMTILFFFVYVDSG